MRVSNRFLYYQLVKDLGGSSEKLFKLNGQISSGKRIDQPSDDPLGLSKVLVNRTELSGFDQFKKSISLAKGWLTRTDTIANNVDELLTRASELGVQMASATQNADTRKGAAEELKGIREEILGLANSKYGNKYLFGGTMTQTSPFLSADATQLQPDVNVIAAGPAAATAALGAGLAVGSRFIDTTNNNNIYRYDGAAWQLDTTATEGMSAVVTGAGNELYVYAGGQWQTQYQGNDTTFSMQIGKEDTVEINVPGSELFRNPDGDVIMSLMKMEQALRNNDVAGIRNELGEIEDASKVLNNKLGKVGAVVNRLDTTFSIIEKSVVDNKETTSDIEDLDYADAITQLQNQQTIYQAALKSASLITSMSLVDYMP